MKVVGELPYPVEETEHLWIPLPDGCRLAARMWRPARPAVDPVPALIEYIPYRKRDGTRWRDEPMHRYFAGHGYAALRIDVRGSGESDGLLADEYHPQELEDGVEAIRWAAAQPWCSGRVGMIGKSWGGFNSLQIAARRPPGLEAILTVCSTDDRYADDAHYMGGCLLNENLVWGTSLMACIAQPPDPELLGAAWREVWLERLREMPLHSESWLRHQRRDEYWKHGSVCEDFAAIRCPVYAVGGWADGYTNAVPRLLAGLTCPRKGLVGPWAHVYPHEGVPGPAIGFLQEALRWWDHWLKGNDTGMMSEPMYRVWMPDAAPASASDGVQAGRWVAENEWPSRRIRPRRLWLAGDSVSEDAPAPGAAEPPAAVSSPQTAGLTAGAWCAFGIEGEGPVDQREDDAKSLTFDSAPLEDDLEILGAPVLEIEVGSDRPVATLASRLNDVSEDGTSTRVSYGLLNLTHRDGHETPEPLEPGRRYRIRARLNDAAHRFRAGHRIRIALSTAYWPVAWPPPWAATLSISRDGSWIELPVRPPSSDDARLTPFSEPECAASETEVDLAAAPPRRFSERDPATGETVYVSVLGRTASGEVALTRIPSLGLDRGHAVEERFRIADQDPLSAVAEVEHETISRRGPWSVRVRLRASRTCSATSFRLEARLEAYEGEERVFEREWDVEVRRDLV